jgi:hypothetical protein
MRVFYIPVVCLGLFLLLPAQSQIFEQKTVHGGTVTCMQTGMSSDLKDCGTRSDWYSYVFVGSIVKITAAPKDEQEIQILPEEVFSGSPPALVSLITSQGLCMESMKVGERWLFYLRRQKDGGIIWDYYANDSLPVERATEEIETLRRLKSIGKNGLLRGLVLDGERFGDGKPIAHAQVSAIAERDGSETIAISDADGRYEFSPLPAGGYEIKTRPVGGRQPDVSHIDVRAGECWDLTLTRQPRTEISGHIQYTDGVPAAGVDVVMIDSDLSSYITTQTRDDGTFKFESMVRSKYLVGVNYPKRADWFNGAGSGSAVKLPPASLFYPNAPNIEGAEALEIKTDERRRHIDFVLPGKIVR